MMQVSPERFEELVADALDLIPAELAARIDNVVVRVADRGYSWGLLGLYEGIPLTRRENYGAMAMPDRITIFREPILALCATEDEVVAQVRTTVIHEIAHHFGISDRRLHELGWG